MPSKSAVARVRLVAASCPSGEFGPNTVLTSAGILSNSILAAEKPPTSQPARVKGTQGAGAILPFSLIICALPSALAPVQYRNELWKPTEPSFLKKPKLLGTVQPNRSPYRPGRLVTMSWAGWEMSGVK